METRQPVEIELTPTEPPRERRRQATPDRPPGESKRSSPLASERGRLVAVAACVGLLALLIGWAAGRATGSDEPATAPATTLAPERLPPEAPAPATTVPGPEETRPPTTGPRPTTRRTTTTTAPPVPTATQVEVHEALAGMPVTIVGYGEGRYHELDLATGELEMREIPRAYSDMVLRAGPDWTLLMPQDGSRSSWLIENGGVGATEVEIGGPWDTYWVDGSPIMWRVAAGPDLAVEAIGPDGAPTGDRLEIPAVVANLQAADPRGGVVVNMSGDTYRLSEAGVELLTTGQLLGISADVMVATECGLTGQCAAQVTDRTTGQSRTVDIAGLEVMPDWESWRLSPDQSQVLVQLVDRVDANGYMLMGYGLLDLDDGTVTALQASGRRPFSGYSSSVGWSPDGRYVFYLGPELMALDQVTGESLPVVSDGSPSLVAFATRASAG